jgi:hypothetical protein
MRNKLWACFLVAGVICPSLAIAGETHVTTYVIKTQEERENTRWTLTEWLKIKERMRMMDVWLAMFSDPKKDKFQPELMLSYGMTQGRYTYTAGNGQSESGDLNGTAGRAQIWLTNLISGTVGIRTLNVDLGVEGYKRASGSFSASESTAATAGATEGGLSANAVPAQELTSTRSLEHEYYTGNLRIFGRNIQDSSLVLKYGRYASKNTILDGVAASETISQKGVVAGAELQLYVFRWLGAEGNYLKYGDAEGVQGSDALSGTYYDYMGFVEISLLRLMGGVYQEDWKLVRDGETMKTSERGTFAGLKLQL